MLYSKFLLLVRFIYNFVSVSPILLILRALFIFYTLVVSKAFFITVLSSTKVLNFYEAWFICFSFVTCDFDVISKKPLPYPGPQIFTSIFSFFLIYLFFNWRIMLYRIFLFSVKHLHESVIGIAMSLHSWTPFRSPSPSHPSRLTQSPWLSSLRHTADSYWLSILHMVM